MFHKNAGFLFDFSPQIPELLLQKKVHLPVDVFFKFSSYSIFASCSMLFCKWDCPIVAAATHFDRTSLLSLFPMKTPPPPLIIAPLPSSLPFHTQTTETFLSFFDTFYQVRSHYFSLVVSCNVKIHKNVDLILESSVFISRIPTNTVQKPKCCTPFDNTDCGYFLLFWYCI